MSDQQNKPYAVPFDSMFDQSRADEELVYRLMRYISTARLVKVLKVTPDPTNRRTLVDIQPLALPTDTGGTPIAEAPIYNVPIARIYGGNSAFIADPVDNDIGLAVFMDRDHTAVVAQASEQPVASDRKHSEMDVVYIGGVLGKNPTTYVQVSDAAGVQIVSATAISLQAATSISLQAGTNITVSATGNVTAQAAQWTFNCPVAFAQGFSGTGSGTGGFGVPQLKVNNVEVGGHIHADPQGGNTGPMIPG